ncbi:hypothetical protein D3C74_37470 [compost metagenome]
MYYQFSLRFASEYKCRYNEYSPDKVRELLVDFVIERKVLWNERGLIKDMIKDMIKAGLHGISGRGRYARCQP